MYYLFPIFSKPNTVSCICASLLLEEDVQYKRHFLYELDNQTVEKRLYLLIDHLVILY